MRRVRDPLTGRFISERETWDMGHKNELDATAPAMLAVRKAELSLRGEAFVEHCAGDGK